jgi:pimeloyl-ACP methyl ester carboxylesterase
MKEMYQNRREGIIMRRVILLIMSLLLLTTAASAAKPTAAGMTLEQAEREQVCAWASMASYNDRLGQIARASLAAGGWQVLPFRERTQEADAKFYFVSKDKTYLLSVAGTENMDDVKVDLQLGKVLFGGKDPAGFAKAAAKTDATAAEALVHRGFNRYTQSAFFTKAYDDSTVGEYIAAELITHPEENIILTGHSLGGAVATLLAARLGQMGVPMSQVMVVSFGAPAVGNAAFARQYGDAMQLDRVIIHNDPVKNILQSLPNGYAQFGKVTRWHRNDDSMHFLHSMGVYADAAIRNYYDMRWAEEKKGRTVKPFFSVIEPLTDRKVYAAPLQITMDKAIKSDAPYMKAVLQDILQQRLPNIYFAEAAKKTSPQEALETSMAEAQKRGCDYIISASITGRRLKDEPYNFQIVTHEEIYDTAGHVLSAQDYSTNTNLVPPIDAVLYNYAGMRENREKALRMEKTEVKLSVDNH